MTATRTAEQMHANLKALELGPMDEVELGRMRTLGDEIYGKRGGV